MIRLLRHSAPSRPCPPPRPARGRHQPAARGRAGADPESDAVVRGTVRRVQSRWAADGRRIVTDVEIEVAETLKGAPGQTVRVTQPGGRVGDIGQRGERARLVRARRGGGGVPRAPRNAAFSVRGMAQGKFQVQRSPDGKQVLAVPSPPG